ncbi:glycosyltransferase family 2 protein [Candidatus Daviesbacteria bacterium]|nr:glycosyltransferase family 2 protein [Candidatus Daviesbacteria bacterium]
MYPKVSIIFVNYNGGKQPIECLKSIFRLNYPQRKIEIIVIDNGSTDGSLKKIKRFHKVKLIENKSNLGFAGSINQGVLISKGEYIFMGNDDIVFEKDSLLEMVQFAKSRPEIGVIGGKILDKVNPKRVISLGYFMNKITGNVYPNKSEDLSKSIDWLQGCALLISRKTLKKVGLFDPV